MLPSTLTNWSTNFDPRVCLDIVWHHPQLRQRHLMMVKFELHCWFGVHMCDGIKIFLICKRYFVKKIYWMISKNDTKQPSLLIATSAIGPELHCSCTSISTNDDFCKDHFVFHHPVMFLEVDLGTRYSLVIVIPSMSLYDAVYGFKMSSLSQFWQRNLGHPDGLFQHEWIGSISHQNDIAKHMVTLRWHATA